MTIRRTMTLMTLTACLWACEEPEPGPGPRCASYGLSANELPIRSLSIVPCPIAPSSAIQEVRSDTAYTTNARRVQAEVVAYIGSWSNPSPDEVAAAFDEATRIVDADGAEVAFGRGYDSLLGDDGDEVTLTFRALAPLSEGVATIESSFLDEPLPFHAGADAAPFVHRIELAVRERRYVFVLTFSEPLDLGPGDVQVRSLGGEVTEAEVVADTLEDSRVEVVEVGGDEPTQPYELLISRRLVSEVSGLPVQWEAPEGFGLPEAVVGANVEAVEADEEWLRVRVAPAPMTRAYVVLNALGGGMQ